ncbi:MAG: hypothetical protein AB1861_22185 [Cyanobacteriota bacterium]
MEIIFKAQGRMTPKQLDIVEGFQEMIEAEYALCASEMAKASVAASEELSSNYTCSEMDAIRRYWYTRLAALIQIIEYRNPQVGKELAEKYLNNER